MKTLLYLTVTRYSPAFHRLYVAPLLERGVPVEVWDLMDVFEPGSGRDYRPQPPENACPNRVFASLDEFLAALAGRGNQVLLLSMLHYSKHTRAAYRAMARLGLRFAAFHPKVCPLPGDIPHAPSWRDRLDGVRRSLGSWNKLLKTIALSPRLPASLAGLPEAAVLVVNSSNPRPSPYPVGPGTRRVLAPSLDHDEVVRWKRRGAPVCGLRKERPLAVFIDGNAPRHPDMARLSASRRVFTEEGLYPFVRRCLEGLQAKALDVVVAAHPRASREGWLEHYDGFTVVQGRTMELIAEGDLVLSTGSTATSFAIVFDKPVAYLTTDEMLGSEFDDYVRFHALLVNKTPHNISRSGDLDLEREMAVDAAGYERYKREYIVPAGMEDVTFWEAVLPALAPLLAGAWG